MDEQFKTTHSFPVFRALGAPRKGPLDRLLSVFADVRAGEGGTALLLALTAFLLLGSYYLLKTVREALILSEFGAEHKAYAAGAQAVLLLGIVPAYGWFASQVSRVKLINWVTVFFISHLALFYLFGRAGAREGIVFFIWVGLFNTLMPAQFWAFSNDLYSESQGKRLFPIVGAGTSIGALAGAQAASRLIKPAGPYGLMLIAAVMLAATIAIVAVVHRRDRGDTRKKRREDADKPLGPAGGFQLIMRERYLLLIAVLMVLVNVVNTGGEYLLGKLVVAEAPAAEAARKAFVGQFYGNFFTWVNLLGLLVQMFLVSRIFHYIGVRGALFILPLIAMSGYASMSILPSLAIIRIVKTLENSTDYSVQNTARHALFLPTSREAKFKAQAAIESFFMRFGDVLAALIVFAGQALALTIQGFAGVNLALTGVWLVVVALIYREHKRRTA